MTERLADFFNRRRISERPIQPAVSPDFFNWRVFQNPLKDFQTLEISSDGGEIIGVCVYTMAEGNRCFVHFLSFAEEDFFNDYAAAIIDFLFADTGAQFIYTWEPLEKTLHKALKKLGFVANPLDKGLFSYRVPLIIRAEPEDTNGTSWFDISNFDAQPLMQD